MLLARSGVPAGFPGAAYVIAGGAQPGSGCENCSQSVLPGRLRLFSDHFYVFSQPSFGLALLSTIQPTAAARLSSPILLFSPLPSPRGHPAPKSSSPRLCHPVAGVYPCLWGQDRLLLWLSIPAQLGVTLSPCPALAGREERAAALRGDLQT